MAVISRNFNVRLLGDPVLREQCATVTDFDRSLESFVEKMMRTLRDGKVGVGLAAPQIGVARRVVVYSYPRSPGSGVFINPEIISLSGTDSDGEACLSFPGQYFAVPRAARVAIRTQTLDGKVIELEGGGLFARLCQHELDHLSGRLIVDHLPKRLRHHAIQTFTDMLVRQTGSPNTTQVDMAGVANLFSMGGYDIASW